MDFLRKHWQDVGGFLALVVIGFLLVKGNELSNYQLLLWLSLVSLFLHQLEEYRIVGTFPGMMNTVMFRSEIPDRYPLNSQSAFCVNVLMGWTVYLLAALFAEKAIWLGIASILISVGNTIAHAFIFNIKGKTYYNAGMATSLLFFLPISISFFYIIGHDHLATSLDFFIGIPLGIILNVVGILKIIDWMKNKNSKFIFPKRNLLPANR